MRQGAALIKSKKYWGRVLQRLGGGDVVWCNGGEEGGVAADAPWSSRSIEFLPPAATAAAAAATAAAAAAAAAACWSYARAQFSPSSQIHAHHSNFSFTQDWCKMNRFGA